MQIADHFPTRRAYTNSNLKLFQKTIYNFNKPLIKMFGQDNHVNSQYYFSIGWCGHILVHLFAERSYIFLL